MGGTLDFSGGQGRALNNLSRAATLSGVCVFLIKLFYFEMIIDSHAGVRNNTVRSPAYYT